MLKKYIFLIIIYILISHPFYFINIIIGKCVEFKIDYINNNSTINYKINHRYIDGRLFNYYLQNNINSSKIIVNENINNIDLNYNLDINKHFIFNYSRYKNYSKFITGIGFFTKYVLFKYSNKEKLRIGIIIDTRSNDNLNYGNYIVCRYIIVEKNDSLDKIMIKIKNKIKKYKNKNKKTEIITGLSYILSDYIFNSHKDFSTINKFNCNFYYKNKNYSKDEFINKIKEGKKVIVLTYNKNNYYINDIKNL